ncbi:MAG: sulfatase [Deltaproteobacteria bacterium]|nr:sulfatase [Deltaproteobacteria bacterium]
MRSTDKTGLVAAVVLVVLAVAGCTEPEPRAANRPNVLFVCIDALRADRLGVYGASPSPSPALDALARRAVVFEQAYSVASWTKPSVPSLLTGLYPSEHGVLDTDSASVDVLPSGVPTLAGRLAAAGYVTGAFVHNDHLLRRYSGLDRGFATYFENAGSPPEIADRFLSWRETRPAGVPWFAYLHFLDPHFPYTPDRFLLPKGEAAALRVRELHWASRSPLWWMLRKRVNSGLLDLSAQDVAALETLYHNEIRAVDAVIGRMLTLLEADGTFDDTMIVVTADHGEGFGERGRLDHGYGLYRELLQVPLILRMPRGDGGGNRVPGVVQSVDAAATILDYLGLDPSWPLASVSLLPAVTDPTRAVRQAALSEERHGDFLSMAVRDERFAYVRSHGRFDDPPPTTIAVPRDLGPGIRVRANGIFDGTHLVADSIKKIELGDTDIELQGPVAELGAAGTLIGMLGMSVRLGDGVHTGSETDPTEILSGSDLSLGDMVRVHGGVKDGVFVPTKIEQPGDPTIEIEGVVTGFSVERGGDVNVDLGGVSLLVDARAQWKHFDAETASATVPPGAGRPAAADEELFDHASDPRELTNVASQHPHELTRLRALADSMHAKLSKHGSPDKHKMALDDVARERLRALGYVE